MNGRSLTAIFPPPRLEISVLWFPMGIKQAGRLRNTHPGETLGYE